jgi:glycosyltransferase involved in cell wall biosynthesis
MQSWQPTVSVVMCTYNGARFLAEQIDSVLQQTYPIYELLVFDDGSTDSTLEILEFYEYRYPVVRVHRNPKRLGFNGNFEQALRAATGDVVAICDQDDVWVWTKIEKLIAAWRPGTPMVYCDSMRFRGMVPTNPRRCHPHVFFDGDDARKLLFANTVSGHAMIIRREFLDKILPFQKGIYYDWWSAFIAADNGGVTFVDEPLVLHRIHGRNASLHIESTRIEGIVYHRNDTIRHLRKFKDAPHVDAAIRQLGALFLDRLTDRGTLLKKFRLFFLIMRYRMPFFYYRRLKPTLFFSHLKYAAFWAFPNDRKSAKPHPGFATSESQEVQ